jgi:hypothetical protein
VTNNINIDEFDAETVKRMVEFMYTKEYNDGAEEQGSEGVSESENAGVRTLNQGNRHTYKLVEFIQTQTQTTELDLSASTKVDLLCATTPAMTPETLLRNVRVNAIADYYDIPQLKQLANAKIQHLLKTSWSADGFSNIVKEVFNSTSDMVLHSVMTLTAATHIEELLELEDFAALEIMSNFSIGVVRNTIAAHKAKEDLSTQKLQAVESQLQYAESRLQSAEQDCTHAKSLHDHTTARASRIIENIDGCLNTLSRTNTCRNCDADFTCYIERGGLANEPKYILRCANCRCRHTG